MKNIRTIGIIGLGLVGGSIAMTLKERNFPKYKIMGLTRQKTDIKDALKRKIIDCYAGRLKNIVINDLIIIATPVLESLKILKSLDKFAHKPTLVIDVGSTKEIVCNFALKLKNKNLQFIGTHPLAGSEQSGLEAACPNLFLNKPWVICPSADAKSDSLNCIKEFVSSTGAVPILLSAKKHDEFISVSSHLMLAAASMLAHSAGSGKSWQDVSRLASSGFRDTTRLASHNPEVISDIMLTNAENIKIRLESFKHEIDNFIAILDDKVLLEEYLTQSKEIRDKWIKQSFS